MITGLADILQLVLQIAFRENIHLIFSLTINIIDYIQSIIIMQSNKTYSLSVPLDTKTKYESNYISTTKYNIVTFFPLSLIIQFKRYANIYFLISAIMQSIPLISPLSPFSAVAPLLFVISLSMLREGYEDYNRYKDDKKSNASITTQLVNNNFCTVEWKNLKPTDLVKVQQNQVFPADVIPLVCSSANGIIYLETSSLDGQKNLKPKNSLKQTQLHYNSVQAYPNLHLASIQCTIPNGQLYEFDGTIVLPSINARVTMTHKNLLLRGSKLKNTKWVLGIIVYTGKNTKIMKNTCEGYTKISNIEGYVNKLILGILLFELLCCCFSSVFCYYGCINNPVFQTLVSKGTSCINLALISFGSYFILNNTMIPISLIVSLQFVKVFQGHFMEKDQEMYSRNNDRPLKCNTVSINQQLGQIEYILSDKTGTLTCNKMVFKQIAVGDQIYGEAMEPAQKLIKTQSVQALRQTLIHIKQMPKDFDFDMRGIDYQLNKNYTCKSANEYEFIVNDKRRIIEQMLFIMSTCHQCIKDQKTGNYQGPSPDEVTLVGAAKHLGYQYISTQNKIIKIKGRNGMEEFELLQVFEFDSDRKRMSVVVKHNNLLKLFVKGADATVIPRLSKNQKYQKNLVQMANQMAKKGLRSLMYAFRILPQQFLTQFPLNSEIQSDLTLIGLTGIEDKLQDFVPETISSLRTGGIKFVLLTGDKVETAENISRSCGLIEQSITLTTDQKYKIMQTFAILQKNPKLSLVVDGSKIDFYKHQSILTNIILKSQSTVFCRVTPNQKAQVVRMVKNAGKRTLAIGDGANDVNMIMEADVGVGLYGEEGIRAAQVSNYAIGQFCLLWKLLLHHGRLNYMRISEMILYFFYKNMVFTIPQFIFSFYCLGSGQSIYLSWAITLFNMTFTFFPVVLRAVFEQDLYIDATKDNLLKLNSIDNKEAIYQHYPKMYYIGQKNMIFNPRNFLAWFILGTLQGILCFIINIYALANQKSSSGYNAYQSGYYFLQISLVTCIVIVVNLKLALNIQEWNWLLVLGFTVPSLGGYFLYDYFTNYFSFSPIQYYTSELLTMPNFYLTQVLSVLGMFAIDLLLYSIKHTKSNLENYIRYNLRKGRGLSIQKINKLNQKVQNLKAPKEIKSHKHIEQIANEELNKELVNSFELTKKYQL